MRKFKSILATVLIAISTIAIPTALIVAPAVFTGCAGLGGGDLAGTILGLGQTATRLHDSYQAGVAAGHLPPSAEVNDKYAQYMFMYQLATSWLKPNDPPPPELVEAKTEFTKAVAEHKTAVAKSKKATPATP